MGIISQRVMDADEISRTVRRMAHEILESNQGTDDLVLLGIPTRGCPLAHRIAAELVTAEGGDVPVGDLDITMYRDDLRANPTRPPHPTHIPCDVQGRRIVLVDDVLYSGRTIAAALDALKDLGRPARVQLAVLVERGHRELPIAADFIGKQLPTSRSERVRVRLRGTDTSDEVVIERVAE